MRNEEEERLRSRFFRSRARGKRGGPPPPPRPPPVLEEVVRAAAKEEEEDEEEEEKPCSRFREQPVAPSPVSASPDSTGGHLPRSDSVYKCEICNSTFVELDLLWAHMNAKHPHAEVLKPHPSPLDS